MWGRFGASVVAPTSTPHDPDRFRLRLSIHFCALGAPTAHLAGGYGLGERPRSGFRGGGFGTVGTWRETVSHARAGSASHLYSYARVRVMSKPAEPLW
jgi:hypothetical protein